jgi:predicted deacylase
MWYTIAKGGAPGTEMHRRALEMAKAFGLPDIAVDTPWKDARIDLGIPAITPEIGGGADFLRGGQTQTDACARGILNVMKHLGMLHGAPEGTPDRYRFWRIHTDISNGPHGGILSMKVKRGDPMEPGDVYGVVYHPFTGDEVARITSPSRGVVMDTGVVWPVVRPGDWLGALGDPIGDA